MEYKIFNRYELMFLGCTSLNSLPDITNWNTENIKNMKR